MREIHIPVSTIDIPARTSTFVDGHKLDDRLSPLKHGHISQLSVAVTKNSNRQQHNLRRISNDHGRSFELMTGRYSSSILFADTYGNIFTSINLKGNDLISPKVESDGHQPSGYKFKGLQDDAAISRVVEASQILRSKGVDTEIILKVMVPKKLPAWSGDLVNLDTFKLSLNRNRYDLDAQDAQKIKNVNLIVTVRGMACSVRIIDIGDFSSSRQISAVFETINLLERQANGDSARQLNHRNKNDQSFYTTEYVPKRFGTNLGLMHNAKLAHNYITEHNVTAIGGIVDLDSVEGYQLGDRHITNKKVLNDVNDARSIINRCARFFHGINSYSQARALENFCEYYIRAREWNPSKKRDAKQLKVFLRNSGLDTESRNSVLTRISQNLN